MSGPRAGHTEKSVRAEVRQAVGAARVTLPGSRAASAAGFSAYEGAAAPSGPQPSPGRATSAPHTASAAAAARAALVCWRRRIRSVGRACSEHGSNSGEESSPGCMGTLFAEASAPPGSVTPVASSRSRMSGSGSFSRPRST